MQSLTTFTRHWKPSYCTFLRIKREERGRLPITEELLCDLRQRVQLQLHFAQLLSRLGEVGPVEVGLDPGQKGGRDLVQTPVDRAKHLDKSLVIDGGGKHDEPLQLLVTSVNSRQQKLHELLLPVAQQLVDPVGENVRALVLDHTLIRVELLPAVRILETGYLLPEILERHGLETDVLSRNAQVRRRYGNGVQLRPFRVRNLVNHLTRHGSQLPCACFRHGGSKAKENLRLEMDYVRCGILE